MMNLDLSSDSTTAVLKLQNKIELMDNERQHLITSSQSLQINYQQQLAALMEAHQAQIKHMEQDYKNQNQRLVQEKEELRKEYLAKVEEWNKERMEQMVSSQSKLDSIQKHWMEEVDELKKIERQTSSEMKLYLEKYYENLNLKRSQNNGDDVQGSNGLEQAMKNCLDLLKQHSEELKALKQQLEEERRANVKENEAVFHRKEVEFQKEQQNEIKNEWKKLEISREQFHDEQNQWKEQLKAEIEEFISGQMYLKEQQTVQNWEDYTQFNSDKLTERNDEIQYGNQVHASQQEFVNKVSSLEEELINLEKDRRKFMEDQQSLQDLAEQVKQRSNEAEEMCMIASKIREEGLTALEKAEKVKQEHQVLASSIQKQMQVLRNKEEFLNKERMDLLSQTGNHPVYYLCKNCLQLNIEDQRLEKELLHPRQTESTTDAMRSSYHYLGNMNMRQAMSTLSGLESVAAPDNFVSSSVVSGNGVAIADHSLIARSLHTSGSNFNQTVDVISWQMVAEQDRETLENEKQFLTSLLFTGNTNS